MPLAGGQGWLQPTWNFGNSANPITTRGADYAHHIPGSPTGFENSAACLLSKENMVVDFIPNSNLYLSYPFSPLHDQCVNQLVLFGKPERAQERLLTADRPAQLNSETMLKELTKSKPSKLVENQNWLKIYFYLKFICTSHSILMKLWQL